MISLFHKLMLAYKKLINDQLDVDERQYSRSDLAHWKDALFIVFLYFCLPVSFIAVVPGVYMSLKDNQLSILVIDILCLAALIVATFSRSLKLFWRKCIVVVLFYILAIALISKLGYIGPGVFYLLTITILVSLIYPVRYAYLSVLANTLIVGTFALLIYSGSGIWPLSTQYSTGQWLAFSSNIVFTGLVLVLLMHRIFNGLQDTIYKKDKLRENYKRIFDNSPTPMWVFDVNTLQFLTVNSAAIQHYGYSHEEFCSMKIQALRPEQYQQQIGEVVLLNKNEHKFKMDNVLHVKKNGEIINVVIESNLLTYKGRQAKLVLATDITAKLQTELIVRQAHQKIKQSEANLQALFKNTIDGCLLLNEANTIIAFNDKAKMAARFNHDFLSFEVGDDIFKYVQPSRHDYFRRALTQVYNGEIVEYDRVFVLDGTKTWIHYSLTPVYEGEFVKGICITGRDITSYKIYIRTIKTQNKRLREISWAQSHQTRAPLVNILGLVSLLKDCDDVEERERLVAMLDQSANKLDVIVRDMVARSEELVM